MIWSITRNSNRFLKIFEDGTSCIAVFDEREKSVCRKNFRIDNALCKRLLQWAKKYIEENKMIEIFEGMSHTGSGRFHVSLDFERLGITEVRTLYIPEYCFDKIDGNGIITELLKLPECEAFIREEVK